MAAHSSILAWKIPWMEELGRLQSMVSQRVGHDLATSLSFFLSNNWCAFLMSCQVSLKAWHNWWSTFKIHGWEKDPILILSVFLSKVNRKNVRPKVCPNLETAEVKCSEGTKRWKVSLEDKRRMGGICGQQFRNRSRFTCLICVV